MATTMKTRPVHKGRTTTKAVRDAAQETTDKMIEALKGGTIPWHKDWHSAAGDMPTSLSTLKHYGGSNVLVLWFAMMGNGWTSPYFGTYDEIAERAGLVKIPRPGGKGHFWVNPDLEDGTKDTQPRGVRKGEKSTTIVRPISGTVPAKDEAGNPIIKDGKPVMKTWRKLVVHNVFNAEQADFPAGCKGVPQSKVAEREPKETIEGAQELVASYLATGPSLGHGGDSAHYVPAADHVQMPKFDDFNTAEGYFSTLYHELTHSTGHDSREAREGVKKGTFGGFGSKVYSEEELVAELGAAMLCAIAGITQDAIFDNSVAYIQHWISKLQQDKNLILRAAAQATKAVTRIVASTTETEEVEVVES